MAIRAPDGANKVEKDTAYQSINYINKPLEDKNVDMATAKISKFFWAKRGRWNAGEFSLYGTGVITHSP